MTPRHKDNFTELRIEEGVVSRLEGHLRKLPKMGVVQNNMMTNNYSQPQLQVIIRRVSVKIRATSSLYKLKQLISSFANHSSLKHSHLI